MQKTIITIVLGVIMMLALVVATAACAGKSETDVSQVQAYADPITEDTLTGMKRAIMPNSLSILTRL